MQVSIVIPYIRPEKLKRCLALIEKNAGIPLVEYEVLVMEDKARIGVPIMVKNMIMKSKGDMICFLGDDSLPQKDFLKNALAVMTRIKGGWGLVGFNDKTGRTLPTHWLGHKRLLQDLDGMFFNTMYWHCYCDNELHDRTKEMGRYRHSKKSIVLHDHPLLGGDKEPDADYMRVYSPQYMQHDQWLFELRKSNKWVTQILVCGNGPSFEKMKDVQLSDFDMVVRINEYELPEGYDQRCDFHVVYPLHHKTTPPIPGSENLYDLLEWAKKTNGHWVVHPFTLPLFKEIFGKDPEGFLTEYDKNAFLLETGLKCPTTGLLALRLATLVRGAQVHAVGFDFYQGERMCYYNDDLVNGRETFPPHDHPLEEKEWYDKQVKEGVIIQL